VPGSKEDVFKDKSVSLVDKRRLMRFLMFVAGEYEQDNLYQGTPHPASTILKPSLSWAALAAYSDHSTHVACGRSMLITRQGPAPNHRPVDRHILPAPCLSIPHRIRRRALLVPLRAIRQRAGTDEAVFEEYRPVWAVGVFGGAVWRGGGDCAGVLQVCQYPIQEARVRDTQFLQSSAIIAVS
jgi:hypothetical protein